MRRHCYWTKMTAPVYIITAAKKFFFAWKIKGVFLSFIIFECNTRVIFHATFLTWNFKKYLKPIIIITTSVCHDKPLQSLYLRRPNGPLSDDLRKSCSVHSNNVSKYVPSLVFLRSFTFSVCFWNFEGKNNSFWRKYQTRFQRISNQIRFDQLLTFKIRSF